MVDALNISTPISPYGWTDCFAMLKRLGFNPRRVLDVGANRGNWTRSAISIFPAASYLLVEPQGWLQDHIKDLATAGREIKWITAGVGATCGQRLLTVTPDEVSSSFLPTPAQASALGFRQITVDISTLNALVKREWGSAPDVVKIDAEGVDLQVLAGASDLFGHTEVFFVEAAVCAPGLENTLFAAVSFMASKGYKVIDITDLNRSPKDGVLWLCELVFLKETSALLRNVSSYA